MGLGLDTGRGECGPTSRLAVDHGVVRAYLVAVVFVVIRSDGVDRHGTKVDYSI